MLKTWLVVVVHVHFVGALCLAVHAIARVQAVSFARRLAACARPVVLVVCDPSSTSMSFERYYDKAHIGQRSFPCGLGLQRTWSTPFVASVALMHFG